MRLEGDDKDGIRNTVVCENSVLIAYAGNNWESSSIVRVQFDDVLYVDVESTRWFAWWSYSRSDGLDMI